MGNTIKSQCTTKCESSSEKEEQSLSEPSPDLLPFIFPRLSFIDQLAFRGVCKAWRSAGWVEDGPNPDQYRPVWVMKLPDVWEETAFTSVYQFNDPSTGKTYALDIPELGEGCQIITARGGWLLVRGKPSSSVHPAHFPVFFLNPFTHARIDLPSLYVPPDVCNIETRFDDYIHTLWIDITAPPTSPDCVVFTIMLYTDSYGDVRNLRTATYKPGRDIGWTCASHSLTESFNFNEGIWAIRFKSGRCESVGIFADHGIKSIVFSCNPHTGRCDPCTRIVASPISVGLAAMGNLLLELSKTWAPMHECYRWDHVFGFENSQTDEKLFCRMNAACNCNEVWICPTWARRGLHCLPEIHLSEVSQC